VFAECLAGGLACGDQWLRTGNGSTLEALRDDTLYKDTFTLLSITSDVMDCHFVVCSSSQLSLAASLRDALSSDSG